MDVMEEYMLVERRLTPIKQFLDFAGWPKIGDKIIRSMTPVTPSGPIVTGSRILANVAGNNMTVVVTVIPPISA
jgi:hypothetical protein